MTFEDRLEKLTNVMERVAVALEAGGVAAGGAGAAAAGKPAAGGAKATGAKAGAKTKPKHTADALKAKFAELKAREDIGTAPLKEIISEVGCENLAELLVTPDKFDAAMTAMTDLEAAKDAEASNGGGDDDEL